MLLSTKFDPSEIEEKWYKIREELSPTEFLGYEFDKTEGIVVKISKGKSSKFINDNSLLNQIWIMDPKKKVSDVLKENSSDKQLKVLDFIRYKVGEGI